MLPRTKEVTDREAMAITTTRTTTKAVMDMEVMAITLSPRLGAATATTATLIRSLEAMVKEDTTKVDMPSPMSAVVTSMITTTMDAAKNNGLASPLSSLLNVPSFSLPFSLAPVP